MVCRRCYFCRRLLP